MPPPKKKEGGDTEKVSLLILRRRSGHGEHGHHGGAWKIAYADFVTAMMAFFLLMWLLNSTNKSDKQGIADFFNRPLSVALSKGNSSSSSSSIINGGGADIMSKTSAERSHGDDSKQQNAVLVPNATTQRSADQQDAAAPGMVMPATDPAALEKPRAETPEDAARLAALKDHLDKMIEMNAKLAQFKNQIRIDITSEGLRIQIVDAQNRPMFQTGRAELEPYAKEILDQIGVALNDVPNHISVAGHTDSAPYAGALSGYSNWELSSERANSARRELGIGGMKELKVLQVRGLADALPLDKNDLAAPVNRRISILVLNKKTEDAFYRDGGRMDLATPGQVPKALDAQKPGGATAAPSGPAQIVTNNRTSSPDGGSPNNVAASPEAVVARIKAAVDLADPAPRADVNGKHGSPSQQNVGAVAGVMKTVATDAATGAARSSTITGATTGASSHATTMVASIGTPGTRSNGVSAATSNGTSGATSNGTSATSAAVAVKTSTAGAPGASAQKIDAAAVGSSAQKVTTGTIAPAPTAAQKVGTGSIAPAPAQKVSSGSIQAPATSAPATADHNQVSDFGHVQ